MPAKYPAAAVQGGALEEELPQLSVATVRLQPVRTCIGFVTAAWWASSSKLVQ